MSLWDKRGIRVLVALAVILPVIMGFVVHFALEERAGAMGLQGPELTGTAAARVFVFEALDSLPDLSNHFLYSFDTQRFLFRGDGNRPLYLLDFSQALENGGPEVTDLRFAEDTTYRDVDGGPYLPLSMTTPVIFDLDPERLVAQSFPLVLPQPHGAFQIAVDLEEIRAGSKVNWHLGRSLMENLNDKVYDGMGRLHLFVRPEKSVRGATSPYEWIYGYVHQPPPLFMAWTPDARYAVLGFDSSRVLFVGPFRSAVNPADLKAEMTERISEKYERIQSRLFREGKITAAERYGSVYESARNRALSCVYDFLNDSIYPAQIMSFEIQKPEDVTHVRIKGVDAGYRFLFTFTVPRGDKDDMREGRIRIIQPLEDLPAEQVNTFIRYFRQANMNIDGKATVLDCL